MFIGGKVASFIVFSCLCLYSLHRVVSYASKVLLLTVVLSDLIFIYGPDDESSDGDDDGHDTKKKFSADVQENILAIQDGPQRTSEFSRTINFNWISDFISANYDS